MKLFGKRLSEYAAFSRLFIGLVLAIGIGRLVLSLGGVPNSIVKWLSITAVMWVAVIYYSVKIHASGFGSYKNLLPICVLLSLVAQVVIVPAISLAIFTGHDNIYTATEYSFGSDGKTWTHVAAHLLVGTTIGSLVGWLVGCLVMFVTKKLGIRVKDTKVTAHA